MCLFLSLGYYSFYAYKLLVTNCKNNVWKGVATEAQMILDSVYNESSSVCMDYLASQHVRGIIAIALTRLEQELVCPAGSDTTSLKGGSQ